MNSVVDSTGIRILYYIPREHLIRMQIKRRVQGGPRKGIRKILWPNPCYGANIAIHERILLQLLCFI